MHHLPRTRVVAPAPPSRRRRRELRRRRRHRRPNKTAAAVVLVVGSSTSTFSDSGSRSALLVQPQRRLSEQIDAKNGPLRRDDGGSSERGRAGGRQEGRRRRRSGRRGRRRSESGPGWRRLCRPPALGAAAQRLGLRRKGSFSFLGSRRRRRRETTAAAESGRRRGEGARHRPRRKLRRPPPDERAVRGPDPAAGDGGLPRGYLDRRWALLSFESGGRERGGGRSFRLLSLFPLPPCLSLSPCSPFLLRQPLHFPFSRLFLVELLTLSLFLNEISNAALESLSLPLFKLSLSLFLPQHHQAPALPWGQQERLHLPPGVF